MVQSNNTSRESTAIWGVVAISVAATFFLSGVPERVWVFSDTAHYMSTARMLMQGRGLQTDLIYYEEQSAAGTIPGPQTVFPPGYSIVVAAGSHLTGVNHHSFAAWLCFITYACVAPLIFLLGRTAGLRTGVAAFCSVLWLTVVAAWGPTWCYSSDIPFLVLTLISMLVFARAEDRVGWLLSAGVVAAVAVSWRYAGVFLGIAYGIVLLFQKRGRILETTRSAVFLIGPSVVMAALLFSRNQLISGTWRGGNNYAGHSVRYVLKMLYYCLCYLTGFSLEGLRGGEFSCVAAIVCLAAIVIGGAALLVRNRERGRTLLALLRGPAGTLLAYTPITIGLLVYLHAAKSSGMSTRLLIPVVPGVLIAVGLLYQRIAMISRRHMWIATVVVLVGSCSLVAGQRQSLSDNREDAAHGLATRAAMELWVARNTTLADYLRSHCDEDNALLSSMPQMTHLFVERPVVGLPTGYLNTAQKSWTSECVHEVVREFRIRYVLVLTLPTSENTRVEFFKELSSGQRPEWLRTVFQQDDFTLYEVLEPSQSPPQRAEI